MTDRFSLAGHNALVTGASSGLGRHFAGVLSAAGATVTVGARRENALADTVAQLDAGRAQAVRLDVTDLASVAQAFAAAETRFGPVTVVINNAGITSTGAALEMTEADWSSVLDTNLRGTWLVAQQAALGMAAHGGGSIVNIASILGLRVTGGVAPYAVSKAGVVQMTKALALEWARHGFG